MNTESLIQALIEQLRTALATTLGGTVELSPATAAGQVWSVGVTIPGTARVTLAFEPVGAATLVRVTTGQSAADEDAIREALRELCKRAVAAAVASPSSTEEVAADVDVPVLIDWPASLQSVISRFESARLPDPLIVIVALESDLAAQPSPAVVGNTAAPPAHTPERLDVLLDIDLRLVVRFGGTRLPLKALSRLGPGSLIDLSRAPDDPVEMLVGDRVVARGVVVVVSGSYGIRVTEIVSGREVSRGLEAR